MLKISLISLWPLTIANIYAYKIYIWVFFKVSYTNFYDYYPGKNKNWKPKLGLNS